MEEKQDIRWKQRFQSYEKALAQLQKFIDKGELNELEEQGLIQAFEYTYELSWQVLKDYMNWQGNVEIRGSRDAFRQAYNKAMISEGETWFSMVEDRIKTVHTYDEDLAEEIAGRILNLYHPLFVGLKEMLIKEL